MMATLMSPSACLVAWITGQLRPTAVASTAAASTAAFCAATTSLMAAESCFLSAPVSSAAAAVAEAAIPSNAAMAADATAASANTMSRVMATSFFTSLSAAMSSSSSSSSRSSSSSSPSPPPPPPPMVSPRPMARTFFLMALSRFLRSISSCSRRASRACHMMRSTWRFPKRNSVCAVATVNTTIATASAPPRYTYQRTSHAVPSALELYTEPQLTQRTAPGPDTNPEGQGTHAIRPRTGTTSAAEVAVLLLSLLLLFIVASPGAAAAAATLM
mmetsp:Transcript_25556/g.63012  ORF Transcript_25556/g.63012 Transcript_25556/m.63012 type:complete len:273 (-) Transcript_25556:301-1119(-)